MAPLEGFENLQRTLKGTESPSIYAPWPVRDILYMSFMAPIGLAAFLEWGCFLVAFNYCLLKVFLKAEHWSTRVMCVVVASFFTCMRSAFLPVLVVTLPLPPQITQYFPPALVSALSWFAFYTFAGLLSIPFLFCIFQIITKKITRKKQNRDEMDAETAPKVVVVMPVYMETVPVLVTAISSIVECDYPPECIHVFLSFDNEDESELYTKVTEKLGVPVGFCNLPQSIDVVYKGARVTVSKFPHGGKRKCQKHTYKLIDHIYAEYLRENDDLFVLFIDSDCILDTACIQNFMWDMELKPGAKGKLLAATGVITSRASKNSFLTIVQDIEYIHGQLVERVVESSLGAVTCLPGALTMLRFSAFRNMSKFYFADKAEQCQDMFDYAKCHLGEDRWLTHIFMVGASSSGLIQMCPTAFCKTEAVQTFPTLLKQRRRWFLGYITNEACMLTDIRVWIKYPGLALMRMAQNTIRTTALLFLIMVVSLFTTEQKVANLPIGFIGISLGLNWVLMIYFGFKLHRYKIWLYPVVFVVNPVFNWIYMMYGIFTCGQRTWGGPRADAGVKADANTSPQAAIEQAIAITGDEFNVQPETFKDAVRQRHPSRPIGTAPVLPADYIEGRFAPAEIQQGIFTQMNDSGLHLPNMLEAPHEPPSPAFLQEARRTSVQSIASNLQMLFPRTLASLERERGFRKPNNGEFRQKPRSDGKPNKLVKRNIDSRLPIPQAGSSSREASHNDTQGKRSSFIEDLSSGSDALGSSPEMQPLRTSSSKKQKVKKVKKQKQQRQTEPEREISYDLPVYYANTSMRERTSTSSKPGSGRSTPTFRPTTPSPLGTSSLIATPTEDPHSAAEKGKAPVRTSESDYFSPPGGSSEPITPGSDSIRVAFNHPWRVSRPSPLGLEPMTMPVSPRIAGTAGPSMMMSGALGPGADEANVGSGSEGDIEMDLLPPPIIGHQRRGSDSVSQTSEGRGRKRLQKKAQ